MLKKSILVLSLFSLNLHAAEHRFIVDIMPASFLFSNDIDGFSNNYSSNYFSEEERVEGSGSFAPNISLGYGLDLAIPLSLDISVGTGVLVNSAFTTGYTQGELTLYGTSPSKRFMMGPFVRVMKFNESSWTTDNLIMDGTQGQAFGVAMMLGGEHVKFKMKVSKLVNTDIKVHGKNNYRPSSSSISLDGTDIELGVGLRF